MLLMIQAGALVRSEIVFEGPLAVFTPLLSLSPLTLQSLVLASSAGFGLCS